jgi:hypothetical protein
VSTTAPTSSVGGTTAPVPEVNGSSTTQRITDPTASLWRQRDLEYARGTSVTVGRGALPSANLLSAYWLNRPDEPLTLEPQAEQRTTPARFDVLQKWEGIVLGINREVFSARLIDATGNRPDQEAEIYVEEVSPRDRKRLTIGAVFYWYVGYRDDLTGDRERASRIRFRRLPPLTQAEVARAKADADQLRKQLGWTR